MTCILIDIQKIIISMCLVCVSAWYVYIHRMVSNAKWSQSMTLTEKA